MGPPSGASFVLADPLFRHCELTASPAVLAAVVIARVANAVVDCQLTRRDVVGPRGAVQHHALARLLGPAACRGQHRFEPRTRRARWLLQPAAEQQGVVVVEHARISHEHLHGGRLPLGRLVDDARERDRLCEGRVRVDEDVTFLLAPHVRHVRREVPVRVLASRVSEQQLEEVPAAAVQIEHSLCLTPQHVACKRPAASAHALLIAAAAHPPVRHLQHLRLRSEQLRAKPLLGREAARRQHVQPIRHVREASRRLELANSGALEFATQDAQQDLQRVRILHDRLQAEVRQ
mmetsp:Transcript_20006/g.46165  ORF Transcript_20006/g.46165 Transcript_20006/m.46165 type:complete len:291 (+) Transcript_20006:626-1498(+)